MDKSMDRGVGRRAWAIIKADQKRPVFRRVHSTALQAPSDLHDTLCDNLVIWTLSNY